MTKQDEYLRLLKEWSSASDAFESLGDRLDALWYSFTHTEMLEMEALIKERILTKKVPDAPESLGLIDTVAASGVMPRKMDDT